jgi:hypothetical protein
MYARLNSGGHCFRFNSRFAMVEMTARIANVVCSCMPCKELTLRVLGGGLWVIKIFFIVNFISYLYIDLLGAWL